MSTFLFSISVALGANCLALCVFESLNLSQSEVELTWPRLPSEVPTLQRLPCLALLILKPEELPAAHSQPPPRWRCQSATVGTSGRKRSIFRAVNKWIIMAGDARRRHLCARVNLRLLDAGIRGLRKHNLQARRSADTRSGSASL